MQVVAITGKSKVELVERAKPVAKDEFAVVKVHSAPMCTEYLWYRDNTFPFGYYRPDALGHEAAGEVVAVREGSSLRVGDRVVAGYRYPCGKCNACDNGNTGMCDEQLDVRQLTGNLHGDCGFTQYLYSQDWHMMKIPDDVSYDHGAMALCALGPSFNAMELTQVSAFSTVLVTALGAVGLGAVINGAFRGARVIGIGRSEYRNKLALELGADAVVNPDGGDVLQQIMELTHGNGVDVALSTIGATSVTQYTENQRERIAFDALNNMGDLVFLGEGGDFTVNIDNDLMHSGKTLRGCTMANTGQYKKLMSMISKIGPKLEHYITHRFPMSRVEDAFKLQLERRCGKIILHPWD